MTLVEKRAIATLAGVFSLRMLGLFMLLPVLPLYANQLNNVTPTLIGLALGIYGLTQAAFQIPFGFLSDHIGRRGLILFGLCLLTVGSFIGALSESITGVIVARALQGMGAIGSVVMAMLSDLTGENIRARAMAIIGITIGLSFVLAIVVGPLFSGWFGVRGIFGLTAVLSLVAVVMFLFFIPNTKSNTSDSATKVVFADIPKAFWNQKLFPLFFGVFVLHASLVALFLKIPLALEQIGLNSTQTWQVYVPVFVTALVITLPALQIIDKVKDPRTFFVGVVILLIASEMGLGYGLEAGYWGVVLSLACYFTTFTILEASLPSWVSKLAPIKIRGTALGIYSSAQFLGFFLGGSIGGWCDTHYGKIGVLTFCFGLGISWLFWMLKGAFYVARN